MVENLKKILLITACFLAFILELFLLVRFSDKIIDVATPERPSLTMNDAVRNGSFIAKLSIAPKNFNKNQFDVEAAWVEYRYRPRYIFPWALSSEQAGYYFCIRMGKQNILNEFRKPLLMIKSEKGITPFVRSMVDSNLYFSKRVTFASNNIALLLIDKYDPQNFKGAEIFIDYIGTALNGEGPNYRSYEILNKNWYSHKAVENRGFNPFFVPFDYSCANGAPDPQQRLTFPALLSMKFDFVDNNICMRHPAFIFLRDPETQELSMKDKQKILSKMEEWGMNVAIGGSITQDGELFSGSLIVIDQQGTIFEKSIDKIGYFELMGEMVAAWMEKSGSPVSHSLKTELLKPMTNNNTTLRLLGQALTFKERSDEQMGLYEKILELDPNFAELRWWYANQKWWQTKDDEWESSMYIRALESHLVVPALREISYSYNTPLANRYEAVFENAKTIIPNHYVLTREYNKKWSSLNRSEIIELSEEAFKKPYAYAFTSKAAYECFKTGDYQVSIPLMLSIILSKFNPGDGNLPEYERIVYSFQKLGYSRDAAAFINPMFHYTNNSVTANLYAGYTMDELQNYPLAIECFKSALQEDEENQQALKYLINTYIDAGKISDAENILLNQKYLSNLDEISLIFKGRILLKKGNINEGRSLVTEAVKRIKKDNANRLFIETALIENDYSQGSLSAQHIKDRFWEISPKLSRAYWFIPVDDLWMTAPRSKKTYLWYKHFYGGKSTDRMRDYLFVAAHLFPNEEFWKKEYEGLPSIPEPNEDALVERLNFLKSENLSRGSVVSGFRIEYICLRLMFINSAKYRSEVLDFYGKYSGKTNGISWGQMVHRKAFLSLLNNI